MAGFHFADDASELAPISVSKKPMCMGICLRVGGDHLASKGDDKTHPVLLLAWCRVGATNAAPWWLGLVGFFVVPNAALDHDFD